MFSSLILALGLTLSFADGDPQTGALFQTLPEDGVWAKYDVAVKIDSQEIPLQWQARMVGKAFHNGKACRILELEQTTADPAAFVQFPTVIWRLVIPEAEFGADKNPLSKAVKVWRKKGDQEAGSHESMKDADSLFAGFANGPMSDIKRAADKSTHSWQRGDLKCEVITGTGEAMLNTAKFTLTHRVLREKSVPFGFVSTDAVLSIEGQATKITAKVSLVDTGKDAAPKLPQLTP